MLKEHRVLLVSKLEVEQVLSYFQVVDILNEDSCERIRKAETRRSQAERLIEILLRHDPSDAYDHLCRAISTQTKQLFLVKTLNTALEAKKSKILSKCVL